QPDPTVGGVQCVARAGGAAVPLAAADARLRGWRNYSADPGVSRADARRPPDDRNDRRPPAAVRRLDPLSPRPHLDRQPRGPGQGLVRMPRHGAAEHRQDVRHPPPPPPSPPHTTPPTPHFPPPPPPA